MRGRLLGKSHIDKYTAKLGQDNKQGLLHDKLDKYPEYEQIKAANFSPVNGTLYAIVNFRKDHYKVLKEHILKGLMEGFEKYKKNISKSFRN